MRRIDCRGLDLPATFMRMPKTNYYMLRYICLYVVNCRKESQLRWCVFRYDIVCVRTDLYLFPGRKRDL